MKCINCSFFGSRCVHLVLCFDVVVGALLLIFIEIELKCCIDVAYWLVERIFINFGAGQLCIPKMNRF